MSDSESGRECLVTFFRMNNIYQLVGDYKYWLMTHRNELLPGKDYVLNRARLYRDRRDFVTQLGDSGKPRDYPAKLSYQS